MKRAIFIFLIGLAFGVNGQILLCDAGKDTVLCFYDSTVLINLGGSPSANGGSGNYIYKWEASFSIGQFHWTASDALNDTTISNPILINAFPDSGVYYLTVVDDSGIVCRDSIAVTLSQIVSDFSAYTIYIQPGDTVDICGGLFGNIFPIVPEWTPNYNIINPNAFCTKVFPDTSTCYNFKITDSAGCEAIQNNRYCIMIGNAGVEQSKLSQAFYLELTSEWVGVYKGLG